MEVRMLTTLQEVLELESVHSYFQPIVSVKKRQHIGAEALARASHGTGIPIPPAQLFAWAEEEGSSVALDRLCRRRALEGFAQLFKSDPELLLFVNFQVSVLESGM